MVAKHVSKSFDDDLMRLDNIIAKMVGMIEVQLAEYIETLLKRNAKKAARVIEADSQLDTLESEVDELTLQMLASYKPMAKDLRVIFSALKTASIIKRIVDHATNIVENIHFIIHGNAPIKKNNQALLLSSLRHKLNLKSLSNEGSHPDY